MLNIIQIINISIKLLNINIIFILLTIAHQQKIY